MLRRSLEAIVLRILGEQVRYLKLYEATIERQHDDDSVDVLPDDLDIRGTGMTNVPIWHGVPGVTVRVVKGSRCLFGFRGGNPQRPYVSLWQSGSVEEIRFNGGTRGVARVGDPVQVNWPLLSAVGTLNGSAFAASLAVASPATGFIESASTKVLAGD